MYCYVVKNNGKDKLCGVKLFDPDKPPFVVNVTSLDPDDDDYCMDPEEERKYNRTDTIPAGGEETTKVTALSLALGA